MLQISLDGAHEFSARLDALPDQLRAALTEKIQALAQALYAQVVGVNLSGCSFERAQRGACGIPSRSMFKPQDARIDAKIFSNGDVALRGDPRIRRQDSGA